jgi:hypothetical protein
MSNLGSSKLNKIARDGLKIYEFAWRYEIQFLTLFTLAISFKYPRILHYSKDSRKTDLIELWSDMLLETIVANPSMLQFRQGLLHIDLQRLYYGLGDSNTPYPNIE